MSSFVMLFNGFFTYFSPESSSFFSLSNKLSWYYSTVNYFLSSSFALSLAASLSFGSALSSLSMKSLLLFVFWFNYSLNFLCLFIIDSAVISYGLKFLLEVVDCTLSLSKSMASIISSTIYLHISLDAVSANCFSVDPFLISCLFLMISEILMF